MADVRTVTNHLLVVDEAVTGKFGCNSVAPQGKKTASAAATDLPTALVLVNQIRAALVANGIMV